MGLFSKKRKEKNRGRLIRAFKIRIFLDFFIILSVYEDIMGTEGVIQKKLFKYPFEMNYGLV